MNDCVTEEEPAMTYHGRVKDGVVLLDGPAQLPDGMTVTVYPVAKPAMTVTVYPAEKPAKSSPQERPPTLYERLKPVIGKAKGLPADAATNLHHYLYGLPKR
jgi:hypothetical protein